MSGRTAATVGRFLEHSRIYYFRNNGAEEYFISSADAIKRSLEARVDVLCPIEAPALARELRSILDLSARAIMLHPPWRSQSRILL